MHFREERRVNEWNLACIASASFASRSAAASAQRRARLSLKVNGKLQVNGLEQRHADLSFIPFSESFSLPIAAAAQFQHRSKHCCKLAYNFPSQPRRDDARTACPTVSAELNFTLPRLRLFMPHLACTGVGCRWHHLPSGRVSWSLTDPAACPVKRSHGGGGGIAARARRERSGFSKC